jgi:phosphoribosylformimino-5-aminoimidazole carboxamide ribotide isomerase
MQLIPAIDLLDGVVVHARYGDRANYRPLRASPDECVPEFVVGTVLALHPFRTLYLADLNAIQGHGDNSIHIRALRKRFAHVEFWVDAGFRDADAIASFCAQDLGQPVVGSESLRCGESLARADRDFVLCLDYKNEAFLGPTDLIDNPALWPERVIVMNLDRVGSARGPDVDRLNTLHTASPRSRFYSAGGLRDANDLERLRRHGAAGVLLATALHAGLLPSSAFADYC